MLTPLLNLVNGPVPTAGLMSGKGTNLERVIEHFRAIEAEEGSSLIDLRMILSENPKSNAIKLGYKYYIPRTAVDDLDEFYRQFGYKDRKDPDARPHMQDIRSEFFQPWHQMLQEEGIELIVCGGFASILTQPLVNPRTEPQEFIIVNVHPGDLRVRDEDGKQLLVGLHAVPIKKAIRRRLKYIRSSVFLIEDDDPNALDAGQILMVSEPLRLRPPEGMSMGDLIADGPALDQTANDYLGRLKERGDWQVLPLSLEHLARGRYARNEQGLLHFDGKPVPEGIQI